VKSFFPVALAIGVSALAVLGFLIFAGPVVQTAQCDGSAPRWMLEAQDYDGGGCALVFPSEEAPANADWTPYCLGLCGCKPGGANYAGVACEAVEYIEVTPEPPSFDLNAVQAHFASECAAPFPRFDDSFCDEIRIQVMAGEGGTLFAPTTLNGQEFDRALAICGQVASAHFDALGRDLGYTFVSILKQNGYRHFRSAGGNTVDCRING